MSIAVRFQNVSKRFASEIALQDVSFEIPTGSIYGLVGNIGSGKTTAIRIILGLTKATSGMVTLFEDSASPRIGYVPDEPALYDWMTAREYLTMSAALASVPQRLQESRINEMLRLVELGDGQFRINTLSLGDVQMLGIAHALINEPELLILDEPTSHLDRTDTQLVLDLIASLQGQTTILFSSHVFDDIDHVTDQVAILDHGRIIAKDSIEALRSHLHLHPRMQMVKPTLEEMIARLTESPV